MTLGQRAGDFLLSYVEDGWLEQCCGLKVDTEINNSKFSLDVAQTLELLGVFNRVDLALPQLFYTPNVERVIDITCHSTLGEYSNAN